MRTGPVPPVAQRASHASLIHDVSRQPETNGRTTRLDAVVVPASRRAQHLVRAAFWAAQNHTPLVILASHDCEPAEAMAVVDEIPGCRALGVRVPDGYTHPALDFATSGAHWAQLNGFRRSNLSLKRNLALLLARLNGWNKILFVDDDITRVRPEHLRRIAVQLEHQQVVGMEVPGFPDNSVVCHANRLSGASQDVFVTGAVLGVNCADQPLSFFPDVYNEDWFFFAEHAAHGGVRSVGEAAQATYDPFRNPARAVHEEFGDLLAEGLYSLFGQGWGAGQANRSYWSDFTEARAELIATISSNLEQRGGQEAFRAVRSLHGAARQLELIRPEDCTDFLDAWQGDRAGFARTAAGISTLPTQADAFDYLGLTDWWETSFGGVSSRRRSSVRIPSPGKGWRSPVDRNPIRS